MSLGDNENVQSFLSGSCPRHGGDLCVMQEDVPVCLRCAEEKKTAFQRAHAAPVVAGPEPTLEQMLAASKAIPVGSDRDEPLPAETSAVRPAVSSINGPTPLTKVVAGTTSLETCLSGALSFLDACPMPRDLKAFKNIQKARNIIEKILNPGD